MLYAHSMKDTTLLEEFRLYEKAREAYAWDPKIDIPWNRPWGLSKDQEELAWKMASQSVSTEEIGLLISARLLQEAEDAPTRLCLATAVSDEAKHCEVFARFSISCGGFIEKPAQYADNLRNAPPKVQTNFCCFTLERFPTT